MKMDVSGFTCFWRIENLAFLKQSSSVVLKSSEFTAEKLEARFYIKITEDDPGFLAVLLSKVEIPAPAYRRFKNAINLSFSMFLMTSAGWDAVSHYRQHKFRNDEPIMVKSQLLSWKDLEDAKWNYLPSGCLTVKFHFWNEMAISAMSEQCLIVSRMINEKELIHKSTEYFINLKPSDLLYFPSSYEFQSDKRVTKDTQTDAIIDCEGLHNQEDLLRLFLEKQLGFVTLRTSEKEFTVHKAVLCAGSPLFKNMFEQNMDEDGKDVIDVNDADNETVLLLLRFLHMEPLKDLKWETALKLFYVADLYQIESLKRLSISALISRLSVQNVCEAFVFANLHHIANLKQSALEHFCQNLKTVLKSMEWKYLLLNQPELVVEILYESSDKL